MADRTVTVAPSGGTYTTLAAAIAGELSANADLTTDNGSGGPGNLTIEIQGNWSGGGDSAAAIVDGFTTSADCRLIIQTDASNRAKKIGWDADLYALVIEGGGYYNDLLRIGDDYVIVDGLQLKFSTLRTGVTSYAAVEITDNYSHVIIRNCVIEKGDAAGTGATSGLLDGAYRGYTLFENCIVSGFAQNITGYQRDNNAAYYTNVYHCVSRGGTSGIVNQSNGNANVKNCASFANGDDFVTGGTGTTTIDHCASDDGDGTNAVAPSGGDWDNEFSNSASGDFTLLSTGNSYHAGVSGTGVSTDIDGDAYDASTPSIGCDEYVAAGGGTTLLPILLAMDHLSGGLMQ